jgi:hypothetical protein
MVIQLRVAFSGPSLTLERKATVHKNVVVILASNSLFTKRPSLPDLNKSKLIFTFKIRYVRFGQMSKGSFTLWRKTSKLLKTEVIKIPS